MSRMARNWIKNLSKIMSEDFFQESLKILEKNGRNCAKQNGVEIITSIMAKCINKPLEQIICEMNKHVLAGGKLKIKDNIITGIYERCCCPGNLAIGDAHLCNCTIGWLKEIFEIACNKSVNVELTKTINRGDSNCEFIIKF